MDHILAQVFTFYLRVNSSACVGWLLRADSSWQQPSAAWLVVVSSPCGVGLMFSWHSYTSVTALVWWSQWSHCGQVLVFCIGGYSAWIFLYWAHSSLGGSQVPKHCKEVGKSWTTLVEEVRGIPCAGSVVLCYCCNPAALFVCWVFGRLQQSHQQSECPLCIHTIPTFIKWRIRAGAACSWRTVPGTYAEAFHQELQPMRRTHLGGVDGGLCPVEGIMLEQGKSVRSLSHKGEELEEVHHVMNWPQPHSPTTSKVKLGRKWGWGKGVLKIWFYLPLSYSDVIGKKTKLISPSQVCFSMTVRESLRVLILTHETSLYFLSPVQSRRGVAEWLW